MSPSPVPKCAVEQGVEGATSPIATLNAGLQHHQGHILPSSWMKKHCISDGHSDANK